MQQGQSNRGASSNTAKLNGSMGSLLRIEGHTQDMARVLLLPGTFLWNSRINSAIRSSMSHVPIRNSLWHSLLLYVIMKEGFTELSCEYC